MRDTARPLPFGSAARAVFDLSLDGMGFSRRSLLMALLVAAPVGFAVLYRVLAATQGTPPLGPSDLYALMVAVYWVRNVYFLWHFFMSVLRIRSDQDPKKK